MSSSEIERPIALCWSAKGVSARITDRICLRLDNTSHQPLHGEVMDKRLADEIPSEFDSIDGQFLTMKTTDD